MSRSRKTVRPCARLEFDALEDRITPSHLRYMNLYWNPDPADASNQTIIFHFQSAWRSGFVTENAGGQVTFLIDANGNSKPDRGDVFRGIGGTDGKDTDSRVMLNFGDTKSKEVYFRVLGVSSTSEDWFLAEAVTRTVIRPAGQPAQAGDFTEGIKHPYTSTGNFTANIADAARILPNPATGLPLKNNGDQPFQVKTTVNVGTGNSAPVATSVPPIIQFFDNRDASVNYFFVAASDPDNDTLTYRFATSSEAQGSAGYQYPPGYPSAFKIDANTGKVSWDLTSVGDPNNDVRRNTYYTIQIMVEDGQTKTPIDLLLQILAPGTNNKPLFDYPPTPATTLSATVGQPLNFTVQAHDPDVGDTVTVQPINAPSGMTRAGGTNFANPNSVVCDWTPTKTGTFLVTFQATDNRGLSSSTVVTIKVGPPPGVNISEPGGSTNVKETGTTTDTYTLTLNSQPTANVIITLAPDAQITAPANVTFTPSNWSTPKTVTVRAVDDAVVETLLHPGIISHTVTSADALYNGLAVAAVTVNVLDNDAAGVLVAPTTLTMFEGGSQQYAVELTSQPTANVAINLNPGSGISISNVVLNFTPATWSTPQFVTVSSTDDLIAQGDRVVNINHAATSTDANYNAISVATVTVNVLDNDIPGVTIDPTDLTITEGGSDFYTVVLNSQPTSSVTISLANLDGLLTVNPPPRLTFDNTNWNVPQTVTVNALNDQIAQGDRLSSIVHTVTSADAGYNNLAVPPEPVTILDDDTPGVILAETEESTVVAEGGLPWGPASDTFTVVLRSEPTAPVVVTLVPDAQQTVTPATMTFTPLNWNLPQPATVRAVDDAIAELNPHLGMIQHTVSSTDLVYSGFAAGTLAPIIIDNDIPGILLGGFNGPPTVLEGAPAGSLYATYSYTVVLQTPPIADVVVTPNPGPQLLASTPLTFSPSNWYIPQNVRVSAVDDGLAQGNHTDIVGHTATSTDPVYNGMAVDDVAVNIIDPDASNAISGTDRADKILVTTATDRTKVFVNVNGKLSTIPLASIQQLLILGGDGNDTIQVNNPTVPVIIDGGPGSDGVFINGLATANQFTLDTHSLFANGQQVSLWQDETLIVGGARGNDVFTVQNEPALPVEFKGDAGTDRFIGPDVAGNWTINGAGAGQLNLNLKFSAVESLTGGQEDDRFSFLAGKKVAGLVDGGGGFNTLDYAGYLTPVTVNLQNSTAPGLGSFQNFEDFLGGKGADKLIGDNNANVWELTNTNIGTINGSIDFTSFENLTGGSGDDTFRIEDGVRFSGKIDGGGGIDLFDYYYTDPVTVNLQAKTATGMAGFDNVESAWGGYSTNYLIGANKPSSWIVADNGIGNVDGSVVSGTSGFTFHWMDYLTGGSSADTFQQLDMELGSGFATINGGAGNDTLVSGILDHTWDVYAANTGYLDFLSFSGVENLQGGFGSDYFILEHGTGVTGKIDGGFGFDYLDSRYTSSYTVNLATSRATGLGSFANLEYFFGGYGPSTLIAPNSANTWDLTGDDEGTLTNTRGVIGFSFIGTFVGGTTTDLFNVAAFAAWDGILDGGSGKDTISGSGGSYVSTGPLTGSLNGNPFRGIEVRF